MGVATFELRQHVAAFLERRRGMAIQRKPEWFEQPSADEHYRD